MKCLRCLGTTNGDFLGPLLLMIHRWLPYPISQIEPRLPGVPPFLTGSWQCCIALLGWFEPVSECCFSRPVTAIHPTRIYFPVSPPCSVFHCLGISEPRETVRGHGSSSMIAASVWQGHGGPTVSEKVGHNCPSAHSCLPATE